MPAHGAPPPEQPAEPLAPEAAPPAEPPASEAEQSAPGPTAEGARVRRRRPLATALGAAGGVVLLLAGYAALDAADVAPGPLTRRSAPTAAPLPTAPAAVVPPTAAPAVLPPLEEDAPAASEEGLAAVLGPLLADPALGPSVSASVLDATDGRALLDVQAAVPRTPASTVKVLTAAAALRALGPATVLRTRVVQGAVPGEVVLVGGGDVLLAAGAGDPDRVLGRAGLGDLAAETAAALRAQDRPVVSVRVDDTAFQGPGLSAGWAPGDVGSGFVAPVSALAVDAGRLRPAPVAPRHPDPAMAAAEAFAERLAEHGVEVAGPVLRAPAPAGAEELAAVSSAPVAEQVEWMLATSDNVSAEALGRLIARERGLPPTFDGASAAVRAEVAALGVPVDGVHLVGTSGLGRSSTVPARTLTGVLAAAASDAHPELRATLTGLPVAQATGTLAERFEQPPAAPAAGVVRAKTGSLNGVTSLAGLLRTTDGQLLAFAVMADAVPSGGTLAARRAMDRIAAVLVECGCR
ncbi:D-alanyl-D-alanine carboxypeptidase/D-alanyl-D-alanine-endopeptidase (penicillin-binding protein 4) [Kineococcus xinjiangensis]|uniref:D-alanyl-D-alanine carboxypeptidase/D-alanyl-D-alanine-endopeptidase (Penicillin-binding protein 4) n=1 Tax=Kineococcus xinjiangensis TaxID=512762 RepID=A0A2S6IGW8_9ACTN|nr:D-alanyl-D-alanine carboxypeptidase/D-alanyl-D-alanine-endopeptidase [Kineococcus xinjiangensis]PPK93426.1 D-alanyl-D-alanine carboxypeptidase/D-alanyl-D-alanine-endopeptidase (penicillin-binding protein 4) [Kineococcus xinjiangensis]